MKTLYRNLVEKTLLIVVENFGLNFSGGSTATARSTEYFEQVFKQVLIICVNKGRHNLQKAKFVFYNDEAELASLIKAYSNNETIGFGDFHVAEPLVGSGMPYFFVYHDNWPEMKNFSAQGSSMSDKVIGGYGKIFKHAKEVFSVSEYKIPFIREYTPSVSLVRNGLSQEVIKRSQKENEKGRLNILMAGNIDHRKYSKAIDLFQELSRSDYKGIQIDILGLVKDESIIKELLDFDFVEFKGFVDTISYAEYDLYLNTSLIENLSLSIVDALANKTPVISFDVGGINEVIDEKDGAVIEAYDVQEMAKKIVAFKNNEISFKVCAELEEFDWQRGAERMLDSMNKRMA